MSGIRSETHLQPKEAVFTMKLEPELRADFMGEVAFEDRPASQVVRELMRGYIEQRRRVREYDDYVRRKLEAGRASMRAGRGRSNDEVEATFAARRESSLGQDDLERNDSRR